MAESTYIKVFERLASTRRFRHFAMIALLAAAFCTGTTTATAQRLPDHGAPDDVDICPKADDGPSPDPLPWPPCPDPTPWPTPWWLMPDGSLWQLLPDGSLIQLLPDGSLIRLTPNGQLAPSRDSGQ